MPQPHAMLPTNTQPSLNSVSVESVNDVHVYFALAMILSVMFLFTGVGIVTLICLLPAIMYARKVSERERERERERRKDERKSGEGEKERKKERKKLCDQVIYF